MELSADPKRKEKEFSAFKANRHLPSGYSIQEAEELSGKSVEEIYINAFSQGLPIYYKDDRCKNNREAVRAMPDGSEDLIDYDWQIEKECFLKKLAAPGHGKYAYLLKDPRFVDNVNMPA